MQHTICKDCLYKRHVGKVIDNHMLSSLTFANKICCGTHHSDLIIVNDCCDAPLLVDQQERCFPGKP
jgi:hypothetical protein